MFSARTRTIFLRNHIGQTLEYYGSTYGLPSTNLNHPTARIQKTTTSYIFLNEFQCSNRINYQENTKTNTKKCSPKNFQ